MIEAGKLDGFVFVGDFQGDHIAGVAGTYRQDLGKALSATLYLERCIGAPGFQKTF